MWQRDMTGCDRAPEPKFAKISQGVLPKDFQYTTMCIHIPSML